MTHKLFRNGTIVAFNESTESVQVHRNASLLVTDNRIAAIGQDIETPQDAEVIDVEGKILTPGFVNSHSHLWQTAFRTLGPNTTLGEYFVTYSQHSPSIKSFSAEDVYVSCLEGYYEGLNGGVTTYIEHAHQSWELDAVKRGFDAAVDGGARVWWCPSVEDREHCSAEQQLQFMGTLGARADTNHSLVSLGLAYDNLSTASPEQIEQTKDFVRKLKLEAITLHLLGGPWPIGANTPTVADKHHLHDLNIPIVFSHGGFVTDTDRAALRKHNWNVSITPESEMHYGHGQQTSSLVLDQASLGIDTNWTFSGDVLTQARLHLQTVRNNNYNKTLDTDRLPRQNPMAVEDAFLLATRQGGRAIRRDDIGVLKVGAKADIVCFDGSSPNMVGWTDPVAAVILHANVGDIEHVLVDGEFRKRDGKLVLKNGGWAEFSKKFAEVAQRIQKEHAGPPPQGEKLFGMKDFGDVVVASTRRQK